MTELYVWPDEITEQVGETLETHFRYGLYTSGGLAAARENEDG